MFEYALSGAHGRTARPYTFMVSVAGQVGLVGLAVLIPLLFTDALPQVRWLDLRLPGLPPSTRPPKDQPRAASPAKRPATTPTAKFHEPTKYPDKAVQIVDPDLPSAVTSLLPHVPGGTGEANEPVSPVLRDALTPGAAVQPPVKVETPPPPPPQPAVPLRIGGNVKAPLPLHTPRPEYPPLARAARISGIVRLEAVITADGTIRNLRLIQGHYMLASAAVAAVKEWRYTPPTLNGQPIEVIMQVDVNFELSR